MKISIAQLNYHIGNFARNKELICNAIKQAKNEGSDLVIFSELSVTGYPPLDMLDHLEFIQKCNNTVLEIAKECVGIAAIVGAPTLNKNLEGKKLYNSALLLSEGDIIFTANKTLLPTYDIFDEYRYFEPEKKFSILNFKELKIALTICEDLWDEQPFDNEFEKSRLYSISPMDELAGQNPDIIINISASPFSYTRIEARKNIFRNKAKKHMIPVISVNQTGANTELIFDGASMIINRKGEIFSQMPSFVESLKTFSLDEIFNSDGKSGELNPDLTGLINKAIVTGIRDYFSKSDFQKAVIGLSGGIDSAVCLCLAVEALGEENIMALLLPSRYSSDHSVSDAVKLAGNLKVKYEIIRTSLCRYEQRCYRREYPGQDKGNSSYGDLKQIGIYSFKYLK
jgi:NAD+ synthase (glutamine-hydrolysing)